MSAHTPQQVNEIAALASVSSRTVSRFLAGKDVRPSIKHRIEAAMIAPSAPTGDALARASASVLAALTEISKFDAADVTEAQRVQLDLAESGLLTIIGSIAAIRRQRARGTVAA